MEAMKAELAWARLERGGERPARQQTPGEQRGRNATRVQGPACRAQELPELRIQGQMQL